MEGKRKRLVLSVALAASSLLGLAASKSVPANVDIEAAAQIAEASAIAMPSTTAEQVFLGPAGSADEATMAAGHRSHASHASHSSHSSHSSHRSGL